MPVLPLCMHVCACYIHRMVDLEDKEEDVKPPIKQTTSASKKQKGKFFHRRTAVIIFLLVTNLPLALYTGLIHQRGTLDVMRYFHSEVTKHGAAEVDILILMPCHSTPHLR